MVRIGDVYFWRQSIVLTADCIHSVGTGFMLAYPAVLNPTILSPNSTEIRATPDQASWIAASQGFAGMVGFSMVPFLMQTLGRKTVHIGLNLFVSIGFLIFALAQSVPVLYIARITQGLALCGVYVTCILLGEYSHPKRRGYFMTLKKCSVAIGSLICHAMALHWTWRQIAVIAIIPHIIAIMMTFLWTESPAFLALNGRYDECDKSHRWLHGDKPKIKKELEELIATQMERRSQAKDRNLKTVIKKMLKKDFLKPFVIASVLTLLVDACGRYYMLAYVVQILIEITGDKSIAAYCTMGADALTVIALLTSCFVIRCLKRRTLLFIAGMISVFLMFLTSLITFLKTRYTVVEVSAFWITPCIILLNVFIVNVGVIPVCFAIIGEIFPLEHKGTGAFATGIIFTILYALVMKFTPLMMEETGIEGTFGIYGLWIVFSLVILYFILNETKDKTLQEIENEIKGVKSLNER